MILLQAHKSETDLHSLVTDILRIFVDARYHVPPHRSQPLFRHLLECVGSQRHLFAFCLLIMESAVRGKDVPAYDVPSVQLSAEEEVCSY